MKNKKLILILGLGVTLLAAILIAIFVIRGGEATPLDRGLSDLLPFGSGDSLGNQSSSNIFVDDLNEADSTMFDESGVPLVRLFRIANTPVSGFITLSSNGVETVRYTDRATGHIYDVSLPGSTTTAVEKKKITNNTLPKIYEAHFRSDGNAVLYRSLRPDSEIVENIIITLTPPTSTSTNPLYQISASNIRGNIGDVTVGVGNNIYYSIKDSGVVVSSTFSNPSFNTIFSSSYTDWKLSPLGTNILLTTRASSLYPGYSYSLNIANGSLTKVLGPLLGLTTMPNRDGSTIFYSYTENGVPRSSFLTLSSGVSVNIDPTTHAEKCVWSRESNSLVFCGVPEIENLRGLDDWYKGKISYNDRIWAMDTALEISHILSEPSQEFGVDVDMINLKLTPAEKYLVFTNKSDLSLWVFRLE